LPKIRFANEQLKDATVLQKQKRYNGAVYLGGYGVGLEVWIISKGFAKMQLYKRYDLVFDILQCSVEKETRLKITVFTK
jgi:hypothetical protein